MWDQIALIGIIAAIIAIVISHCNFKKKKNLEAALIVAVKKAVKSHHKTHKKGQKRQY